jgi:hypothetical protein
MVIAADLPVKRCKIASMKKLLGAALKWIGEKCVELMFYVLPLAIWWE